jgi:hypothetical protein
MQSLLCFGAGQKYKDVQLRRKVFRLKQHFGTDSHKKAVAAKEHAVQQHGMHDVSFSTEDMSLTRLQKRFVHAGEMRQKALVAGLERGRQAVKVSDHLRY